MAKKILLADDSITIQKVIELTFSDEDFDVVTVGNGRLALEKLEDVRPDIVLCDIIMPEKDGYEVCQQIKSNPAFSHVPVLLLTGAFEPFDQEKATQVGSNGFLAKPFEPETLIAKVKDLMGRAGGPDEGASPAGAEPVVATPPDAGQAVYEGPSSPADDVVTATTAPQPAVAPSPPPAEPASPEAQPSAPATFIPEEPVAPLESAVAPEEPLAPVTPEESATLAGEPPAGAAGGEDSASTVMFNAGDLPWTGQTPPESPGTETAAPLEPPPAEAGFAPTPGAPDLADEAGAAFEEVLEEDLEFGGGAGLASGAKPGAPTGDADAGVFTPGEPLTEAVTGTTEAEPPAPEPEPAPTFEAVPPAEPEPPAPEPFSVAPQSRSEAETPTAPTPALETRPPLHTEPPVPPEAPPTFEVATPASEPEPLVAEAVPEPQAVFEEPAPPKRQPETLPPVQPEPETPAAEPPLAPLAGPEPSPATAPPAAAPGLEDTASFADVQPEPLPDAQPEPVAGAVSASEAASVPVPVEQVEKIAQRVVAQVSEKVVREIAWEVIPDLAEALIKQEIERLKAELEKL
jgi:CheY-like chemotaxis protein